MIEAYPLQWPLGYKRTPSQKRIKSRFQQSANMAQMFLRSEVARLGAANLVVSSNAPVKKDGTLYSDWMNKKIDDPGVAIYFIYRKKEMSMCCDQYATVWENVYALAKGIEALRGIERWGISEFMERSFTGFAALPEYADSVSISIWNVLGLFERPDDKKDVEKAYREMAKTAHPDAGGSTEGFQILRNAYKQDLSTYE